MSAAVILDFLSDPMGGLLTSARAFLDRLRRFDKELSIVVLEMNGGVSQHLADSSGFSWINLERPHGMSAWQRMAWQNLHLPGIARQYQAGVYLSLSHYLPWTLPAHVKTIVGISNLAPFSADAYHAEIRWGKKLRLQLLRYSIITAAKRADRVVALSDVGRRELLARGVPADQVSVIPNGVAEPLPASITDGVALETPHTFILCVSHFYRYKNYERLVRAYGLLPENLRDAYALLLVGAPYDPDYFAMIQDLVAECGLQGNVRLISGLYGVQLAAHYRRCSLFVFPSLIENSPITLLEAMSYGAPVAAADIPAMREFGGDAVAYFDAHSETDLASMLADLLNDPARRASMAAQGAERISRFNWDNFTRGLLGLIRDCSE